MIINIIICLIGLFGLFYGGEKLVNGSVNIASILKVNPQFIAITIIAFGTSFPELVVSVNAVVDESPGIAWGNVVGSNISNILLVIGLASLIAPLSLRSETSKANIFWLFFSTLILFLTCIGTKKISFFNGLTFLFILLIILSHFTYISKKDNTKKEKIDVKNIFSLKKSIFFIFFGVVILVISAEAVVYSAVKISSILGVPETFIGLTIIAIGTSLPEIAASLIAVKRGHAGVAIGNVIGSNIFNTLGIIGAAAIFSTSGKFLVPTPFLKFDIPIMLISTLLFCSLIYYKFKINRNIGVIFIISYFLYVFLNLKVN
ncbi:MAG: calcium/sodium antiporter [Paracoccaceae bacterium]